MGSALILKIAMAKRRLKNSKEFHCFFFTFSQVTHSYLAELLSHIKHSLSKEVFHHHLIEKSLAVCLPAAIYSHTADVRIKILEKKKKK